MEKDGDTMLDMAKDQGYVPKGCYLKGQIVTMLIFENKDPCKGCHLDRKKCGGRKNGNSIK